MPVIHVLDKHVAELIAAGEVVERPASAVKELMENAIDAGASSVTVEIQNGGISYLRITDDGCGIARSDVKHAFLRHATSKIQNEADLERIGTLGFRGEALASIAAVSRVEMLTRPQEEELGTRIVLSGGEIESFDDAGCPKGTTIIVRDIFFNTPARMKFLKKDVSEGNAVANVVEKAALSRPDVSVRFLRDNQERLYTPGDNSLKSAIYSVLGKKFTDDLLPIHYENGGLRLQGYISKPFAARANRTMQNFFVNNRFVKSRTCMVALEEGYKHSIMTGKFPACVLHISIPEDTVDVNVHPAKIEVRFENEKRIFDLVYYGVKTAIMNAGVQPEMTLTGAGKTASPIKGAISIDAEKDQLRLPAMERSPGRNKTGTAGEEAFAGFSPAKEQPRSPVPHGWITQPDPQTEPTLLIRDATAVSYTVRPDSEVEPEEIPRQPLPALVFPSGQEDGPSTENAHPSQGVSPVSFQPAEEAPGWRLVGEVFRTYIILERGNDVVFIDKHAAHERLLFNRLKAGLSDMDRQFLLTPVMVTLSAQEHEAVCTHIETFAAFGFDAEDFGDRTVLVRSAPMLLDAGEIENCVCEIATSILLNKKDLTPAVMDDLYHSIACKAAMKAHDQRDAWELRELTQLLDQDSDAKFCPHGRPVSVSVSKRDLEKRFGRQ